MMSSESPSISRRSILSASASIAALGAIGAVARAQVPSRNNATLKKQAVILFQGDSITEFAEAAESAPREFWLWDGIHPTVAGHAIMANKWREVVGI